MNNLPPIFKDRRVSDFLAGDGPKLMDLFSAYHPWVKKKNHYYILNLVVNESEEYFLREDTTLPTKGREMLVHKKGIVSGAEDLFLYISQARLSEMTNQSSALTKIDAINAAYFVNGEKL